jgi:hypothetical protein
LKLGLIVEGHGEVAAAPVLIRRLALGLGFAAPIEIPMPLRVPRGKLVKEPELRRSVELMARKVGEGQPLLVLLDADDDCPADLGPRMLAWANAARADRATGVVVATAEFEAWFLASARSLRGKRGLPDDLEPPPDPERVRDAKSWLGSRMPTGYSETTDQPAFAAIFGLREALVAPSFGKLVRDVRRILGTPRSTELTD